jgi:hypothetical protein
MSQQAHLPTSEWPHKQMALQANVPQWHSPEMTCPYDGRSLHISIASNIFRYTSAILYNISNPIINFDHWQLRNKQYK